MYLESQQSLIESLEDLNLKDLDVKQLPHLPVEIWILIFSHLDFMTLLIISRVNKRLMEISNYHILWRDLCFKHSISLENQESLSLFSECLLLSDSANVWKKLFIRHFKNEHRNIVLSKILWASHEVNTMSRLLNVTNSSRPRLLTYGGSYIACPQCEREKDFLGRMEITSDHGIH